MGHAIPETWVEKLFVKMDTIYGAPFADMWRAADADEMKSTWRQGLSAANLTDEGLRRGVAALFRTKRPPNLPEFIELCSPTPAMYRQSPLALTDEQRTPPEQAREQLAKVHDLATDTLHQHSGENGVEWAYRIIRRYRNGEHITIHQLQLANEAIAAFNVTHGKNENNHVREPGSDDE
ncbi:hypothetical protein [Paraburkholderia adhaesiva]|uniref:hypothetical protein n=1 Tax=Paraburkholderia adhaesiva TaxID=2883244 RepID=UPI001F18F38E|nr:hypothetical protein [Paraburkholderia adhaesiva]